MGMLSCGQRSRRADLLRSYKQTIQFGGRKIMEKKIESLIKEHKIIAILRGVPSEKIVDVAKALDGDGPFSPERSGGLPTGALVKACFSGKYTQAEVGKMLNGNGGFNAYVGSNDMRDLLKMIEEGDKKAEAVVDAFHYQLCKEIGAMSVVLGGKVDQIILTGGIAYSAKTQADMKNAVEWIAPVTVYPGEDELLALAQGALRVMNGEEEAKVY